MIEILKLDRDAKVPSLANPSDAGLDLCTIENAIIPSGTHCTLKTGLAFTLPFGTVGLIWPRSKLASKLGLDVLAGVVDAGYRGEVMVSLVNHGTRDIELMKGDKVAQMIVQSHCSNTPIVEVHLLGDSDRGTKGINDSELRLK